MRSGSSSTCGVARILSARANRDLGCIAGFVLISILSFTCPAAALAQEDQTRSKSATPLPPARPSHKAAPQATPPLSPAPMPQAAVPKAPSSVAAPAPAAPPPAPAPPVTTAGDDDPPNLPAASRGRMHECGKEWQSMKAAGQTVDKTWRQFAQVCLIR